MELYIDRINKKMQIITSVTLDNFHSFKIYLARGNWKNGVELHSCIPKSLMLFDYDFTTNESSDIWLIGNENIEIEHIPFRNNINNSNRTLIHEAGKIKEQRRRRLMMGEEVILYLSQNGERCTCYDEAYGSAQQDCKICNGTGVTKSYFQMNKKIVIPDIEVISFNATSSGEKTIRRISGAWSDSFPYLQDKDVVERKNGERYQIQKTKDEYFANELIGQDFDLISLQDFHTDIK